MTPASSAHTVAPASTKPMVGMAPTPTGLGYWLVGSDGGVFALVTPLSYGSMGGQTLDQPIVGMAATASGDGYWLVASDGGIFAFGDAGFFGSTGGQLLDQPVGGHGADRQWERLLARRLGRRHLRLRRCRLLWFDRAANCLTSPSWGWRLRPPATATGSSPVDGGIFTFGDAGFYGSEGGQLLFEPVVGMGGR